MKKISFLGCGWLGLPLAVDFSRKGWQVKGSTRSKEKIVQLRNQGIEPYEIDLNDLEKIDLEFFDSDILFLNIPPRNKENNDSYHLSHHNQLLDLVRSSPISWVILVSSTGIYPNTNRVVSEKDASNSEKSRGGVNLMEIENTWLGIEKIDTTVIRFAGLYGPNREPGRFFEGKTGIPGGNNPINMIHLDDCIGVIECIVEKDLKNEIFNACSPNHQSRKDFYKEQASKLNLDPPSFLKNHTDWKIVSCEKLICKTGYNFKY